MNNTRKERIIVTIGSVLASPSAETAPTKRFAFHHVDVFSSKLFWGNPLAVVVGAEGFSEEILPVFSKWTNLSETTFLLRPTRPEADYRVRIFTGGTEIPFAGQLVPERRNRVLLERRHSNQWSAPPGWSGNRPTCRVYAPNG